MSAPLPDLAVVTLDLLEALAGPPPKPPPPRTPASPSAGGSWSRLDVARWLSDKGVDFRVKPQPDGQGRTVYVLHTCPFNPDHGAPDACIMQGADGKMSAKCFHNSCQGRGWQDFKQALGAPARDHYDPPLPPRRQSKAEKTSPPPRQTSGQVERDPGADDLAADPGDDGNDVRLRTIQGNHRQLREVTADALDVLMAGNDPPVLFQRGNQLTRIRPTTEEAPPALEPLSDAALRGLLARAANWVTMRCTKDGDVPEEDAPPMEVVKDLAALPAWEGIPVLEGLVETPVFAADATLVTMPGYHPQAGLWLHLAPNLFVPNIPNPVSPATLRAARDLLLNELLGDFPFVDDASRAHALAALLLPFAHLLIRGPTPLHLFDAPTEGTGKSLLAEVLAQVALGHSPALMTEASTDDEWRKRLTALLLEAPVMVLLDNLKGYLDSGALAALLTCRIWKDRLLGASRMVTVPNTCVWLASGNNVQLSNELRRRTVLSRLDAACEMPSQRQGFRHPQLLRWVRDERGRLIAAALILIQAWLEAGRPDGAAIMGSFDDWAAVMGGILDVAGVPGLLGNLATFRAAQSSAGQEWRPFLAAWFAKYGEQIVGVDELYQIAKENAYLEEIRGGQGERSQRIRLGKALAKIVDRVFEGKRMRRAAEDHCGRQRYRLENVSGSGSPAASEEAVWEA